MISFVKPVSSRMQLRLVALGYGAVLIVAAALLYGRHLVELADPVAASGGMAAFGDTLLYLFIGCLFMIPTAFLIWIAARFEVLYTAYSQSLLGLSLSAPVCLSGFLFGENHLARSLGWFCLFRIMGSPVVLVGMGISRLVARFDRAKRLASCALLIEGLTLGVAVAIFIHG
jgi:hypothetical protein